VSEFLSLAAAGAYVHGGEPRPASARWARRHLLPHVVHFPVPHSGTLFRRADIDQWLMQFRRDPVVVSQDLDTFLQDALAAAVPTPDRKRRATR
jgi:hypothetical protein